MNTSPRVIAVLLVAMVLTQAGCRRHRAGTLTGGTWVGDNGGFASEGTFSEDHTWELHGTLDPFPGVTVALSGTYTYEKGMLTLTPTDSSLTGPLPPTMRQNLERQLKTTQVNEIDFPSPDVMTERMADGTSGTYRRKPVD